jgi:choline dehydrogenase
MAIRTPESVDTLVLGGGTTGAVVAGLLADGSDESVLVIEAGPDYGPYGEGGWPSDLLEARDLCESHGWGLDSGSTYPDRVVPFERARVLGGCSSHNGCAAIWGCAADYDAWAAAGNDGWASDDLLPLFSRANERMRVRIPALNEVQPFQRAFLDAAPKVGIPLVNDLNDFAQPIGIAPSPVNITHGVRWNSAFAYLDPVRDRDNLTIIGNTLVDRVLIEDGRVVGAVVLEPSGPTTIAAKRVIVSGGSYGSPAILQRSGIGATGDLAPLGIETVVELPGVGRNLHDHPAVLLSLRANQALVNRMEEFALHHWLPEEQVIAKARSSRCTEEFDIHIYPVGTPYNDPKRERWDFFVPVACMTPKSRGELTIVSTDPNVPPAIEHRYATDPDDIAVLVDAIALMRRMFAEDPLVSMVEETSPGPELGDPDELAGWIARNVVHYYHPVGTCRMGPATDPDAVVDSRGKVHGVDGLYVADCSIIPIIPRANTNIPAVMIGERIASWLMEE